MLHIYDRFSDITDAANAQVGWLSNFAEGNLNWKKLKYECYYDFLKALDSCRRFGVMIEQYQSAQRRKTQATQKLGNLWQAAALFQSPGHLKRSQLK